MPIVAILPSIFAHVWCFENCIAKGFRDKFLYFSNFILYMTSIILVEPETEGNIGAVARVMKNFDFEELILINPKANHLGREALDRATHAKDILKKAKVKDFSYLKKFDYLIGTTAMLGSDYNIPRSPLTQEQLAEKVSKVKGKIGILIGREG